MSHRSTPRKQQPRRKRPAARPRYRAGTENDLITAVGSVLVEQGPTALSVSAVARRAGVDKALVYRYFGSFERLLRAYADSATYWPTVGEICPDREALLAMPFARRFATVVKRYTALLRARPTTIALLASEVANRSAMHEVLEARREAFGLELLRLAQDAPPHLDVAALASVLTAGIHYLLIRSRQIELFNGIPLRAAHGWSRIESAIERMIAAVVGDSIHQGP